MNQIYNRRKILICAGSGGVGKTTLAAAIAVAAAKEGLKVLVLTIDPSKRLAQTLGIEGTKDITEVPLQSYRGRLFASVVDHKKTFDDFIIKAAGNEQRAQRILNNGLYKQLSTTLSGSQEFTALEKLYSIYESKEFDLIVLDTPPAKHAMDFLGAPQKLSALFQDSVTKWFRSDSSGEKKGFLASLLNTGTKQVMKILEMLTGGKFIEELTDFFSAMESWQGRLFSRMTEMQKMLKSEETGFCLVTSFEEAKLKEAEIFIDTVYKAGYHLDAIVINRTFPFWLNLDSKSNFKSNDSVEEYFAKMKSYYQKRSDHYSNFENRVKKYGPVYRVPDLVIDISDLVGLEKVSSLLRTSGVS